MDIFDSAFENSKYIYSRANAFFVSSERNLCFLVLLCAICEKIGLNGYVLKSYGYKMLSLRTQDHEDSTDVKFRYLGNPF